MDVTAYAVPRDVVQATGADAIGYLHGQLSQRVDDLDVGETRWSLLLEPRGQVEVFLRITRTGPETLLLDTDAGFGDTIRTSLDRFKLRTKVVFEPLPWTMLALRGDGAAAAGKSATGTAVSVALSWPGDTGVDLLGEAPALPGVQPAGSHAWERHRIAVGFPRMGADITPGTIPNETGIVALAVSFDKGCYRGQELVERISSRGAQRLVLRRLRFDAAGPRHDPDDRTLTSIVSSPGEGSFGLGYVRGAVEPGQVVDVAGVEATVLPLLAE